MQNERKELETKNELLHNIQQHELGIQSNTQNAKPPCRYATLTFQVFSKSYRIILNL